MSRERELLIVLILASWLILPVAVICLGCRAVTGSQRVPDNSPTATPAVQEPGPSRAEGEGATPAPADRAQEPSGGAPLRESVAPALPMRACSLWGHLAPNVVYRRALDEIEARYQSERRTAGTPTDPAGPLTVAEVKLRRTRALEAARYTYRHAHLLQRLPADKPPLFTVKGIQISGNTRISADDLLFGLPAVYVDSRQPEAGARDPNLVYDFRALSEIVQAPGRGLEVSQRTIQGLTKYILGRYKEAGFVGIYVYVSASAVNEEARLVDGILPLRVIEAKVARVTTKWRDFQGREKDEHILKEGLVEAGSPVREGQVIQKGDLDQYVRLLNVNPDRRVAAVASPSREPNAIDLSYDVYERDPWHLYTQLDNSGPDRRQWDPRLGLLNTNLTGRDDRLSAMVQADVESPADNYAAFLAYDFPLFPRLRLGIYGGISEFDITPEGTGGLISFLGEGWFTGLTWRYNLAQVYDCLLDVTGSVSREVSQVDRSVGTDSDVEMTLAGLGLEARRTRDTSETSVFFDALHNFTGAAADFENARLGADPDFIKWSFGAAHWQFLDAGQVHQISGRFRDILPNGRLVPAKMTTFGGLYSVRGYPEDLIVADGGILASVEYRFYLTKHFGIDAKATQKTEISLVGFSDYGRPTIKDPMVGEFDAVNMWGVGLGAILEVKPNFLAAVYYGWALQEIKNPSDGSILTDEGDGQWNFNFVYRFR